MSDQPIPNVPLDKIGTATLAEGSISCHTPGLSSLHEAVVVKRSDGVWEARMGFSLMGHLIDKRDEPETDPFSDNFRENYGIGKGSTKAKALEALREDLMSTLESLWADPEPETETKKWPPWSIHLFRRNKLTLMKGNTPVAELIDFEDNSHRELGKRIVKFLLHEDTKPESSEGDRVERQAALDRLFARIPAERVFDDPIDGSDFDFELMQAFDQLGRRWGTKPGKAKS